MPDELYLGSMSPPGTWDDPPVCWSCKKEDVIDGVNRHFFHLVSPKDPHYGRWICPECAEVVYSGKE